MSKLTDAIIGPVVTLVVALAVVLFMWGVFELIKGAGDPEVRQKGQQHILWSVVGLAIMFSVYGILRFIANSVGAPDPFL
jgi:hypothetical protein